MDPKWMTVLKRASHTDVIAFFEKLKSDGFSGIAFDIAFYVNSQYDNHIFYLNTEDPKIARWTIRSPTLDEIAELLDAIDEAGLDAQARGSIYISNKCRDASWGAEIAPSNPKLFFERYGNMWVELAPFLEKHGVDLVTPFIEMDGIEKYTALVEEFYARLSEVYKGKMGFEDDIHSMIMGRSPAVKDNGSFEQAIGKFFGWVSSDGRPIGIEMDCWTIPMETQADQRVSVMSSAFVSFFKPAVDYYEMHFPNTPIRFGEIGVYVGDGVCLGADVYYQLQKKIIDDQEVSDIWVAYFKGLRGFEIQAFTLWCIPLADMWDLSSEWGDYGLNIGFALPVSPAYRVIKAIIKPEE